MDDIDKLESLEKLLSELSIDVRYEKGDFVGGIYRYHERKELVLNRALGTEQKILLIAKELKNNQDLENLYITPALREIIDSASGVE